MKKVNVGDQQGSWLRTICKKCQYVTMHHENCHKCGEKGVMMVGLASPGLAILKNKEGDEKKTNFAVFTLDGGYNCAKPLLMRAIINCQKDLLMRPSESNAWKYIDAWEAYDLSVGNIESHKEEEEEEEEGSDENLDEEMKKLKTDNQTLVAEVKKLKTEVQSLMNDMKSLKGLINIPKRV